MANHHAPNLSVEEYMDWARRHPNGCFGVRRIQDGIFGAIMQLHYDGVLEVLCEDRILNTVTFKLATPK